MLSVEEALARILETLTPPPVESVPVAEAFGRFLAEPISAPGELPGFDNSAMDGYAVRAEDIAAARAESPVRLRIIGHVAAGSAFHGRLTAGTCVRLFTGSPLPAGADAVVMQEDTRADPAQPGEVSILDAARPGENVRLRGEDVKHGAALAAAGERVTAPLAGLLAAVGLESVRVAQQPRVALLATGSELREPGQPLAPGQIHESNRVTLAPLLSAAGGQASILPLVPDTAVETRTALERAFAGSDVVITSGGASVGELDFVKSAFAELGGELDFWRVAMKPGKPFLFGRLGGKFLFGLPGNPVSAFVTFLVLVRPALLRWQGATHLEMPRHPGVLAESLTNRGDRRHFLRVQVDAAGRVRSAGPQASHHLGSLAAANGLLDVPPDTVLAAGAPVEVRRWD